MSFQFFLSILCILLVLSAAFFGWRYFRLRHRLSWLAKSLRASVYDDLAAGSIPLDDPLLGDLPDAVQAMLDLHLDKLDELGTEHARLAAVLDQMSDGVLIADPDGRIQFANPAAARLFDYGTNSLLYYSVTEVLRHHQLVDAWQRCQQSGHLQTESVELPAQQQYLQLIVNPDRDTPGGSLLLVQDLTRVRRLETVRRDFISNLSHELRTPLASLKALAETLQEGALDDPPAARRFLDRMQTEVDALTQMAAELLELSRIESGQVPLELRSVSPYNLLNSSAERMRLQVERAGLTISIAPEPGLPNVKADASRLEQVLVNLIHNAVKFTSPGGKVCLFAEADNQGFVRFSVRDTGAGIPDDVLPRIFERFYKVDASRTSGGTGLGLSIARHLVAFHGGHIWAESLEGKGSTFSFTVPVVD